MALVTLEHIEGTATSTVRCRQDGSFALPIRRSGTYHLHAVSHQDGTATLGPLTLNAFANRELPALVLQPLGTLKGIATYPDGSPAPNLIIEAYSDQYLIAKDDELPTARSSTVNGTASSGVDRARVSSDESGKFSFRGLEPGRYFLRVPSAMNDQDRKLYETGTDNIRRELVHYRLQFLVTNSSGQPVPRASIHVFRDASLSESLSTSDNGRASLRVTPGSYAVTASRNGYGYFEQQVSISVADYQKEIELILPQASATGGIRLNVLEQPNHPIPHVHVDLMTSRGHARLNGLELPLAVPGQVLEEIPPGDYMLHYRIPWVGSTVQYYQWGATQVVVQSERITELTIVPTQGGRISVRVPPVENGAALWYEVQASFEDETGMKTPLSSWFQMDENGQSVRPG